MFRSHAINSYVPSILAIVNLPATIMIEIIRKGECIPRVQIRIR